MQDNESKKAKPGIRNTTLETQENQKSIIIIPNKAEELINNKKMENQKSNNMDVIDKIVSARRKKKEELQNSTDDNKIQINNVTFFTDNSNLGIVSKTNFLEFMDEDKAILKEFEKLLKMISQNKKLQYNSPYASKDGNQYYSIKVLGSGGELTLKIMSLPWIDNLIEQYTLNNNYKVQLDLDSLYDEADHIAD